MMQHVTDGHGVARIFCGWKARTVVLSINNRRLRAATQINPNHVDAEHCAQVMRDKAAATTDIQHFSSTGNYARDLQRHIVSAANFAAPALAFETALQASNKAFK